MKARILCTVILLVFVAAAGAQTFRGGILGTVTDSTGAVVVGAQVTIRNVDTGLERTATTDSTGFYVAPELPIGNYRLTVAQSGFQTASVTGIRVEVAAERRVDVALQPGMATEVTEVTGSIPLVESTTNVLGGTLEARQVEELPINGRDFGKLLVMVPGASGDPVGNTDFPGSFGLFSTNGNRGRANNFLLDGTDMNDGFRNLPSINEAGVFGTPASLLPLDAIAEARVLTNFEPEFGRNGGSVVNIVTRSGTNELHGSVYEFFRNDALNARNYFNTVGDKDKFRNNNFGGTLGGPIQRDKTFFFVSYEGQRERGAITTLASVPDPADYATATNPVIQDLLDLCASTSGCSGGNLLWPRPTPGRETLTQNAVVPAPFRNRLDSVLGKLDHNFDPNNLLTGRYFFGDSEQSFPLGLAGGNNLPGTNTFSPIRVQLVSISYVRVISPTATNEARFGWNRYSQDFLADDREVFGNPNTTLGLDTGVTRERDFGLPTISVGGFASLGSSPFSNPRGRHDTNWHILDNIGWKRGPHDLKFGVEFRRTAVESFNDANFRSKLSFDSLPDFLNGVVSGGRGLAGNTDRETFQNSYAFYVQDSWRVTSRLTFNWGLRYDYFGVLDEKDSRMSWYDPSAGLVELGSAELERLYERDFNNFGPRLSFAWDPAGDGKTVVRAGWGLFYDAFSQDFFIGQIPWNTFNTGVAYNPIGSDPVFICFSLNPALPGGDTLAAGTPVWDPSCFQPGSAAETTDLTIADPGIRTPYIQNYNLNIQRELWKDAVVQIAYVGSAGRKLFRTREVNQSAVPGDARPFDTAAELGGATAPGSLPFIVNQVETTASSIYNSLQVSFRQKNWRGLSQTINWTWGHSIDTASDGIESVPNQATPDNSNNPGAERANSNFDTRHRLMWNWIYDLPQFGSSYPRLTSGWQLSGVLSLQAGFPYHVNFVDDFDVDGFWDFILRPDLVGDPFLGTGGPHRFLNLAAFKVPCDLDPLGDGTSSSCTGNLHYGNLPRNFFRGPNYRNFDLSIAKNTALTERLKLQLRVDFYNLTNHPNFASPTLPAFIALAGFQGIDPVTGLGGAAGTDCTGSASDPNCFLPLQATPDTGIGYPSLGGGGPRNVQLAVKFIF